jgi:hypothetical protein
LLRDSDLGLLGWDSDPDDAEIETETAAGLEPGTEAYAESTAGLIGVRRTDQDKLQWRTGSGLGMTTRLRHGDVACDGGLAPGNGDLAQEWR